MTLTELLADDTAASLIAQLLTQQGSRIRVRIEGPMTANVTMRGGTGEHKREIPFMGGEEFTLTGATFNRSARFRQNDLPLMVKLAPRVVEEYRYFDHRATAAGGGVGFALPKDGHEPLYGVLPNVIEMLLDEQMPTNPKSTWRDAITAAVSREKKKEAAQQLDAHGDFGSW